ncbi:MAG: hypothetical protein ABIJ46_00555 [bacterium]
MEETMKVVLLLVGRGGLGRYYDRSFKIETTVCLPDQPRPQIGDIIWVKIPGLSEKRLAATVTSVEFDATNKTAALATVSAEVKGGAHRPLPGHSWKGLRLIQKTA